MRYIDSGTRDPHHALGHWLNAELSGNIIGLRIQSGFYSGEAFAPFRQSFASLSDNGNPVRIVLGSNDGETLASHLRELVTELQLPKPNASLGVVYYQNAYYHPKTYHFLRADGSQTAYVGSANFTLPGVTARHVEAGIILDSRNGDALEVLDQIAQATDQWFENSAAGFERVASMADVGHLLDAGIIRATPLPRPPRPSGAGGQPSQRPRLNQLVTFNNQVPPPAVGAQVQWQALPTELRTPPYPPYIFFAPDAEGPTVGPSALTNNGLGDAAGLIVKLNRDNDRHWRGAKGTANVSIPVSTAATIRFGVFGDRNRPRAEFDFFIRYATDGLTISGQPSKTGLMSFGFTPGDVGHGDLRLVIPAAPIRTMQQTLQTQQRPIPKAEDLALLEWPTPTTPTFKMTFIDQQSALGQATRQIWNQAAANEQLASRGACWLPSDFSPKW
ncbi:phospholipase D family protein [Agrobacterium salinitolerans]|uniref:Phospholipase D family protein n=1 Tax=Agrobacterium salinitolerans TaxID=1183413 RepID=A0A9X3KNI9_9HYPH|nr:phospholipase D family protein [Agrobacterium salinitolerans]MCZ7938015.1 phospholipase D family protein [Agrobacterium salinitolerans]